MGLVGREVLEEDISIKACTEDGESVVPARVGDMKPSSRTSRRDAARIKGIKESVLVWRGIRDELHRAERHFRVVGSRSHPNRSLLEILGRLRT